MAPILCLYAPPAFAQAREPWTIVLMHDNDSFLDADRHYTAGDYASATSGKRSDCEFCETIAAFAMPRPEPGTRQYRLRSVPDLRDRPYAGWLFLGGRIFRESGHVLDRVEISAGVVGPGSGADAVQRYCMRSIGSAVSRPWAGTRRSRTSPLLCCPNNASGGRR
jgi:hypothetical protein